MKNEKNVLLALDVDQTLADIVGTHLMAYNRLLGLGMYAAHIPQYAKRFPSVFAVPEIAQFRAQSPSHEQKFLEARAQIRGSQDLHESFPVIPDAASTLNWFLSQYALLIGYFTVRPPQMLGATSTWLQKNGFPYPHNVQISTSHEDKILQVLAKSQETKAVLVDDNFAGLADAVENLTRSGKVDPDQLKNLTLVGFGDDALKIPQNTSALPNWKHETALRVLRPLIQR